MINKLKLIFTRLTVEIISGCLLFFCSCNRQDKFHAPFNQCSAVDGASAFVMLDLDNINNPEKEWCYSPKSTTVIGIPFMPRPVQVTYDGAIYTRDAELCFFYGDSLKPVMARQKTFLNGWIPVVQYDWEDSGVNYALEMFGTTVTEIDSSNTIQFVQVTTKNTTENPVRAVFASASRFMGEDHRFGSVLSPCGPATRFEMKNGCLIRDDRVIYTFPDSSVWLAVPDKKYHKPFLASEFSIPEKRVNDSYKAGLVHLMLATRQNADGKKRQGSGLPYDELFFNDYVDMRRIYDLSGHPEFVDINVQWLMDYQNKDVMFLDPVLTHGKEIMASHGQALVSLANHYIFTRDTSYARRVYHNLWCLLDLRDAIKVAKGLGQEHDVRAWSEFHDSYKKSILEAIYKSVDENKESGGYVPTGLYDFITGPAAREGFHEYQTNQDWENNLLIYPTEVLEPEDHRIQATLDTILKKKYREGIMTYRNGMHLHQYATVNQAHQYLAINNQKQALLDLYHIILHNGSTHEGFENMVEPWEDMDPWPIPPPHAWVAAKTSLLIRNMLVREYSGEAGLNEKKRSLYLFSVISPFWAEAGKSVVIKNAVTEMGRISAELKFEQQGARITIKPHFYTPPASIVIAIPWFVDIKNVRSNAVTFGKKGGYLVFSPDVTNIELSWKIKKNVFENSYQDLLMSYWEENSLKWRGLTEAEIIAARKGFLLENEKSYPAEPVSFDLVRKAFIKEYNRRFNDYIQAGKQPMVVLPPPLVPYD